MCVVSVEGPSFSGLTWTSKLLPRKHKHSSICHARWFGSAC